MQTMSWSKSMPSSSPVNLNPDSSNRGPSDTGIEMREAVFLLRDPVPHLNLSTTSSTTTKAAIDHTLMAPLDGSEKKPVAKRDERRRATHNEVERRRRDKINSWIIKLGSIIPATCDSPSNNNRHGGAAAVEGLSKGGILSAACEFINELKEDLTRTKLEVSTLCNTTQFLMEENTRLQQENQQLNAGMQELRDLLSRHGIDDMDPVKSEVAVYNPLSS